MSAPGAVQRVAVVMGTAAGGTGMHVRMIAAGCADRAIAVHVLAPVATDTQFAFGALPGVAFTPVEFGDRPRPGDAIAVLRLRLALRPATVVHAHGLRAGALAALALGRFPVRARSRRPPLVVTVHNAPPAGWGVPRLIYRLLERLVVGGADLVLCVSADLEKRMRAAGARQVDRAVVSAGTPPAPTPPDASPSPPAFPPPDAPAPRDRPIVLAVGRLTAQKGIDTLLKAAASWRDITPEPLLVIAGDGPQAAGLRARAAALGVEPAFLGHRDDVPALLAAAAVFVLPSRWEGQPLVLQEAMRAGVPIVASRTGGIPCLTGDDAALLVPPGDVAGLAGAVRSVLADPAVAARLRAAARRRARQLPSNEDAVTAALAAYERVLR